MALRKYMLLLPCAMLFMGAMNVCAVSDEEVDSAATERVEEELSVIDQIRQALDEDGRDKLDALLADVQNLSEQLQQMQPDLESRHSDIISQLKALLQTDQIPFNMMLVLGDDQQLEQDASE